MLNVTETVKSAFKSDIFKSNFTLTIGSEQYTAQNILNSSASLVESLCSTENIDFNSVEKSELTLSLINVDTTISDLLGSTLTLTQTVLNETIPYGVFTIVDVVNDGDYLYEITAYDNLHKFDVDVSAWWNEDLRFPITVRDLLISLCTQVGVSYNFPASFTNSDFQVSQNIYVDGATGIDFLRYIQEVIGAFVKPSRTGVMELREFVVRNPLRPHNGLYPHTGLYPSGDWSTNTPSILYTVPITMSKLEIPDYQVSSITKLQIRGSEDDIGIIVGSGDNAYIIEANPLLYSFSGTDADYAVATAILNKINKLVYVPCKGQVKAQPYIEVGDIVKFETYEGKIAYGPLLTRTMTGFLLNADTVGVQGTEKRDATVQAVNKTTKVLNQKLHEVVNSIEELSSTISNVQTNINGEISEVYSAINQTATDIRTEVSNTLENYDTKEQVATAINQSTQDVTLSIMNAINGDQMILHFLFDNEGVHIATLDENGNIISDYQSLFTTDGMVVKDKSGNITLLAEKNTVDTSNLSAHIYLRVMDDSRETISRFQGFYNTIHNKAQQGIFWEKWGDNQ